MSELATALLIENVNFKNEHPGENNSLLEILAGLHQKQKNYKPKIFLRYPRFRTIRTHYNLT